MIRYIFSIFFLLFLAASAAFAQADEVPDEVLRKLLKEREKVKQEMVKANETGDYDQYKMLEEKWNDLTAKINARQDKLMGSMKDIQKLLKEANTFIRDRKYPNALANFEKILGMKDQLDAELVPEIKFRQAFCLERQKNYPRALEVYAEVTALAPDKGDAFSGKARVLSAMGRDSEAIADFKKAIELDPDNEKNYFYLAQSYQKIRMFAEAEQNYALATEKDPKYEKAYYNLGFVRNELKKFFEAIEALKKAVEVKPNYYLAFTLLAKTYNTIGNYSEALNAAESALNLKPNYTEAHFEKGIALEKTERYDSAIKAFENCLNDRAWRDSAQWHINLIKEKYLKP